MHAPWFRLAVRGQSMIPTLAPGEWVLVRRTSRPRPGTVVAARLADRLVVKRAVREEADGRWWVEGDNAAASTDSRTHGTAEVVGEVRWRYKPLRAAGRVR